MQIFFQMLLLVFALLPFVDAVSKTDIDGKLPMFASLLVMGEDIFRHENQNRCVEKLFCVVDSEMRNETEYPIRDLSRVMTNSHGDADSEAFAEITTYVRRMPNFSKMVDAMYLGQRANTGACESAYHTCPTASSELVATIRDFGHAATTKRGACGWAGLGCGAAGVGCGVCSWYTAFTCSAICGPEVATACGAAGVACGIYDLVG